MTTPDICDVCEVDHNTTHPDLSHGKVYLMRHQHERLPWMEWPISGDHLALQRAGTLAPALLFSVDWASMGEYDVRDVGDEDPMRRPATDCATCDGGGCGDCA
jgi:hypothetical protein